MWHMQRVLARSGGVGAMGHLGNLGVLQKLAGYNIVYSYCIQCDILLSLLSNDPKDPKATFPL
jgi:hypothetical protein